MFFYLILNLFGIAFAAGTVNLVAGTANLNLSESAVAALVVVLAGTYVTFDVVVYVYHIFSLKGSLRLSAVNILCANISFMH